jgi:hypothetical protein
MNDDGMILLEYLDREKIEINNLLEDKRKELQEISDE